MPRRKCFLVCNAHLDPAWLWPWEDGFAETLSTFRVAADFCDRHPDFVFNHSESLLYEWVERNDPGLFARIKEHVANGRWHIAGGAYLQFDMIAASGESMIRQFLLGKRYFRSRFGVEPTTAYNFDPFGHPQGLVPILAGCGFDSYVFCRPGRVKVDLPVGSFRWRHASGAEIVARRSDDHYLTNTHVREWMHEHDYPALYESEGDFMYLWGIGNHGGGPSEAEYAELLALKDDYPDIEFIESTPEAFFAHTLAQGRELPRVTGDLKPTFEGCYSSMQRVKAAHRRCENIMHAAERLAAMAWWRGVRDYPQADLTVAWKDLLFAEFHDILPGSGAPSVEADSLRLLGHCEEILRRKKAEVLVSLLRREPKATDTAVPIFVFNPHPYAVTQDVTVEYNIEVGQPRDSVAPRIASEGEAIALQREKPEHNNLEYDWRVRVAFAASVPAMSLRRYDATYDLLPDAEPESWRTPPLPDDGVIRAGSERLAVEIDAATGLVDAVRFDGADVIGPAAFRPLVLDDIDHSWDATVAWREPVAAFRLATPAEAARVMGSAFTNPSGEAPPVSVIENGPVRTIVEVTFVCEGSYVIQRYTVSKTIPTLRVDQVVFWSEHDRMLKLAVPHRAGLDAVRAEKAYSIDTEAPVQPGDEVDFQRFLCLDGEAGPWLGIISHGTHAYSHRDDELRLTVLRSPAYARWTAETARDQYTNRYVPRHAQGVNEAAFTFVFGTGNDAATAIARAAQEANVPLEPFVYYPGQSEPTRGEAAKPFVTVGAANVSLGALKRAEDGDALILRFWETAGRATRFAFAVDGLAFDAEIGAHALATFRLDRDGALEETDLIERPLP